MTYSVAMEIEGPAAIFTRPDSGASFVSYPAPTYSAVKGMFECVARWKSAYIQPTRVEICKPIQFQSYATNYGGPLQNPKQIAKKSSYQLSSTILIDVCYKVYGEVTELSSAPGDNNHLHALQELFQRRLKQGRPVYVSPPARAAWIETDAGLSTGVTGTVAAHGALAMTTPGDTTMATLAEVKQVMKGFAARIAR